MRLTLLAVVVVSIFFTQPPPDATVAAAAARLQAQDPAGAARILEAVTMREPANGRAWRMLGVAYQRTKDQNFKVLSDLARAAAEAQVLELEDRDERNRFITTDVRAMPFSNEIPGEFDLPFLSADALTRVAW